MKFLIIFNKFNTANIIRNFLKKNNGPTYSVIWYKNNRWDIGNCFYKYVSKTDYNSDLYRFNIDSVNDSKMVIASTDTSISCNKYQVIKEGFIDINKDKLTVESSKEFYYNEEDYIIITSTNYSHYKPTKFLSYHMKNFNLKNNNK